MTAVTTLRTPDFDRYDEWRELMADYGDSGLDGSGFWGDHQPVLTPEGYRDWVAFLLTEGNEQVPPVSGRVKSSYFWIVDDADRWVGYLALRRSLNDFLLELGGHIGYSVRPSRRREGHASRALALGVAEAAALGIDRVLVTCDENNLGSRRTIEGNGGVLEDVRQGKRRYWITT
jgi:predicted acetyltransferase